MPTIDETRLAGSVRDRPINDKLRRVLLAAASEAGIDVVRVISGGQPGTNGGRTGSTRHDGGNAADIELLIGNRILDYTCPRDLPIFQTFIAAAGAYGAIGMGAGTGYMGGRNRVHIGFGTSDADRTHLVWGAGGHCPNAPKWLAMAAERGWARWVDGRPLATEAYVTATAVGGGVVVGHDTKLERFRPLLDFIACHEGTANQPGGGYNTSLGYGCYLPYGKECDLVNMTLAEIDVLGKKILNHPANTQNSSALGRYQIVGKTLRELKSKLNLKESEKFSPLLQDRLAVNLIERRGRNARALGKEWQSLQRVPEGEIYAAYDKEGTMWPYPEQQPTPDRSDLVAALLEAFNRLQSSQNLSPTQFDLPSLRLGDTGDAVLGLQKKLDELRYFCGGADGKFGKLTRDALASFQLDNGLPATGIADPATWAALVNGDPRSLPDRRSTITAKDLREMRSVTIQNADRVRILGWLTGVLGLGGLGNAAIGTSSVATAQAPSPEIIAKILEQVRNSSLSGDTNPAELLEKVQQIYQQLLPVLQATKPAANSLIDSLLPMLGTLVPGPWGSVLTLGLGVAFHLLGSNIIDRRVQDQREGRNIGDKVY